ncbi:MAG: RNA-binding protein [Deinococcota bacterium]|nr:RNA-binding protein [Deinococcota bacterium]
MAETFALAELATAALGGRVAHSGFLEPDEAARAAADLRARGLGVTLDGGYGGAKRRVLTAYPAHIPRADTPLAAVYYPGVSGEDELRAALRRAGLAAASSGDVVRHQDGLSVIVLASELPAALSARLGPAQVAPREMELARYAGKGGGKVHVIVPSLRVDALGAKAFKVSRAYFSKGVLGGKVRVNGKPAGKATAAAEGDEIYAEGLGRFTVSSVAGETRKGNLKVVLTVERSK